MKIPQSRVWIVVCVCLIGMGCEVRRSKTLWVYGVTPGEVQAPGGSVWVRGRGFTEKGFSVHLRDTLRPRVALPVGKVFNVTPHGFRIELPRLPIRKRRARIELFVLDRSGALANLSVPGKSNIFHAQRRGLADEPRIQWQFLRWEPRVPCDDRTKNCAARLATDLRPKTRSVTQTWHVPYWARFLSFVQQTERDWATSCSEAWQAPKQRHGYRLGSGGLPEETAPRKGFNWSPAFWLETARNEPMIVARNQSEDPGLGRLHYSGVAIGSGSGPLRYIARGRFPNPKERHRYLLGERIPEASLCSRVIGGCPTGPYRPRQDTITVSLHGVFLQNGLEVDPMDPCDGFRAIAGGTILSLVDDESITGYAHSRSERTDTSNIVFLAESPALGTFRDPRKASRGRGIQTRTDLFAELRKCRASTGKCWWGPSRNRDSTPNLLSHEMTHLLGFADLPKGIQSAVEDTPFVGSDSSDRGQFRRGFDLDLRRRISGKHSPKSICQQLIKGQGNRDFVK